MQASAQSQPSGTGSQRVALAALLHQTASIASQSRSALEATGTSPTQSRDSSQAATAPHHKPLGSGLARLHAQLAALLPCLPPAVTSDARCGRLKAALAQLPQGGAALHSGEAGVVLRAARVAVDTLTDALASFAGDLRTAHQCRHEAAAAAERERAAARQLRGQLEEFRAMLASAADHMEQAQGVSGVTRGGRSERRSASRARKVQGLAVGGAKQR